MKSEEPDLPFYENEDYKALGDEENRNKISGSLARSGLSDDPDLRHDELRERRMLWGDIYDY